MAVDTQAQLGMLLLTQDSLECLERDFYSLVKAEMMSTIVNNPVPVSIGFVQYASTAMHNMNLLGLNP
jgi:hypothetical protein